MSINLKTSASAGGTRNTFDRTVNFVSTYSGVSGGSKATNDAALSAFNTAYAAFSGRTQLVIPPGDYDFTGAVWGSLGGDKLTITATGATLRNQTGFANSGLSNDNTHHANIVTVSAGASIVSLVTPAQTSRFTSGQWVLVTEGDLQGGGYPINPWKFEYKQIQSIGTGTLTFTAPLDKSYSSTFPNYVAGDASNIYQGGPATVYALLDAWDQEIELQGGYIVDNGNLFYEKCRVAKCTDTIFETYGPCPTVNVLCVHRRCTTIATELEVDKLVQRFESYDNNYHAIVFQNSAVNELVSMNDTCAAGQYWRGVAGGQSIITNLSTPTFWFGVKGYGTVTGNTKLVSCNAAAASYDTSYRFLLTDYGQPGSGALTITSPDPQRWAIPGGWCAIVDGSGNFSGITFQVTNIAFSGGVTTISTTLSTPVPGTSGGFSAPWYIVPHPGKDTTLITCTGNSVFTTASGNPANSPIFGWS
jgi:hypothetical protein